MPPARRFIPSGPRRPWIVLSLFGCLSVVAGCATTAEHELPTFTGPVMVPAGAAMTVTPGHIVLSLDQTVTADNVTLPATDALKDLRRRHNVTATESFSRSPDTLALFIAPNVLFRTVRAVVKAAESAGFTKFAVVGRGAQGALSAFNLSSKPPGVSNAHNIGLRWGHRPGNWQEDPRKGIGIDGIELVTRFFAESNGSRDVRYRIANGVDGGCPAITYDSVRATPILDAVPKAAEAACSSGSGPHTIMVAPAPRAPWAEVMAVAASAGNAKGCRSAIFIEPPSVRPIGCLFSERLRPSKLVNTLSSGAKTGLDKALSRAFAQHATLKIIPTPPSNSRQNTTKPHQNGAGSVRPVTSGKPASPKMKRHIRGTIGMGPLKVTGQCDKSTAEVVLRRRRSTLLQCYDGNLAQPPTVGGTIGIRLVVGRTGLVVNMKTTNVSPGLLKTAKCAHRTIIRLRFPPPSSGVCVLERTLSFTPAPLNHNGGHP